MNDRDHFAAAALTGFIRGMPGDSMFHLDLLAKQSFEVADAMLRERVKTSAEKTTGSGSVTLTGEEREAVEQAEYALRQAGNGPCDEAADTIRKLLERLGGDR